MYFTLLLIILTLLYIYLLLRPMLRGAIYYPTRQSALKIMTEESGFTHADKLVDLGSGDGRIVVAFARKGIPIDGYEINPILVWYSRRRLKKEKLDNIGHVYYQSFWKADLSKYTGVIVFGITYIMQDLVNKLKKELKESVTVVSCCFTFPGWEPFLKKDIVFFYKVPSHDTNKKEA